MMNESSARDEVRNFGDDGQTSPRDQGEATQRARRLIPERLDFLIGERPLLWHESPEEYDALREEIFAEIVPNGTLEAIMVKNLVDVLWEARRLRRLKVHAIHERMPSFAVSALVADDPGKTLYARRGRVRFLAEMAGVGVEPELDQGEESLSERFESCRMTPDMLHYRMLSHRGETLDDLDRRVQRVEDRFYQLLRQFEARRAGMAAMARTLMERERSEVIDVEVEG